MLPQRLNLELRRMAEIRGTSQSSLIAHLLRLGLATESANGDPLLQYIGTIEGPSDLSATVDQTVYGS